MSVTPLRPYPSLPLVSPKTGDAPPSRLTAQSFATLLMTDKLVAPHQILNALSLHRARRRHLVEILLAQGVIEAAPLYAAMGRHWSVGVAKLQTDPADPRLTRQINPVTALREGILPWRKSGNVTVIATAYPDQFHHHKAWLEEVFGPVAMAIAPLREIETALLAVHGAELALSAETRVAASESCRRYTSRTMRHRGLLLVAYAAVFALMSPIGLLVAIFALALLSMFAANLLKFIAFVIAPPPARGTDRSDPYCPSAGGLDHGGALPRRQHRASSCRAAG